MQKAAMNKNINVALVLVVVILIAVTTVPTESAGSLQWDNDSGDFNPVSALDRETRVMGAPDHIDKSPGGLAIWREDTLKGRGVPLVEIVLKDESIAHMSPAPHRDYLYATYKLKIPRDRIGDVLALSDSVTYDTLKQEITTRCHFMGANYATLYLSSLIANGTMGKDVARDMYGPAIMQTVPGHATYDPGVQQQYINHLQRTLDRG